MDKNKLVKLSLKDAKNDEVIAEISVKKGIIKMDYNDGNEPLPICRSALMSDCIGNMFDAMQKGNDTMLKENANDFLLALLLDNDESIPDFYISCESHEGCKNDKNCAKA